MKLQDFRDKIPQLSGLDDESALNVLQKTYYPTVDRARMAEVMGITPAAAPVEPSGLIRRIAGDGVLTAVKGAIGVPEAAVGLADMVTGGRAGKLAEEAGFRPKEAKAMLDEYYSPEQKAAFSAVQGAANPEDGLGQRIMDTGAAAVRNPSTIAHAVGESLPSIGAGGVIGRGVMALAPKAAGYAAAGIGEGVIAAGSGAEQMRQQTADGYLTGEQSMLAAGSGALTGGLGIIAGRAAKALGIGDIDTLIVGGAQVPQALQKGFTRKLLEGAFTEGVMEELPQSIQEQVAQNYALGKPLDEGVDQAVVMGLLSGGAMGAGAQVLNRNHVPNAGPLSRAANAGIDAAGPVVVPPAPPPLAPEQEQSLLDHANARAREIEKKAKGTKDEKVPGPDGKPITIPGLQPEFLTPAEKEEQAFLAENGGDAQALAQAYPGLAQAPKVELVPPQTDDKVELVPPANPVEAAKQQYLQDKAALELQAQQAEEDRINTLIAQAKADETHPDDNFWAGNEPLMTDQMNPKGQPFKEKAAAVAAAKRAGSGEVVPVTGGFVVRKATNGTTDAIQPGAADSAPVPANDAAASVGTGPGAGAESNADQARPDPADLGAAGGLPGGTVDGAVNEQNPQAPAIPAPTQAPGEAPQAVAGDAAATAGLPATGTGAVEAAWVAEQVTQPAQPVMGQGAGVSQPKQDAPNQKALDRIAKGTAYFGTKTKASDWIATNGLNKTHEVVKHESGANRWDIREKVSQVTEAGQDEHGARWNRMTTIEREAVAMNSGLQKLPAGNVSKRGWQALDPVVQDKMKRGMDKSATGGVTAPVNEETSTAPEHYKGHSIYSPVDGGFMARDLVGKNFGDFVAGPFKTREQARAAVDARSKPVTPQLPPAAPIAPKDAPVKTSQKQRIAENLQARSDYFTPGNIVQSYGGTDEVLSYTANDDGGWSVKVQDVKKVDGEWVRTGKPQDVRTHSTQPDAAAMAKGPVERLASLSADKVKYSEPRADGAPFPNAVARGKPQDDWTVIGKNKDGKTIVSDKRGVRSYVENGIRVTESVAMRPTREGMAISTEHKGEYLTAEESKQKDDPAGFEPVGARAFKEGKPRLLPTELRGLKLDSTIAKEWYRGWDTANAAAPVTADAEPKVSLGTKAPGDGLLMANGNTYSIDGIDTTKNKIRALRNPNTLGERSVLLGQAEFDKLVADDTETRAEIVKANTAAKADGQQDELDAEMQAYENKPALLAKLKDNLSSLADRAGDARQGDLEGRIRGFTIGMKDTDSNLTQQWVNEVVTGYEKQVSKAEKAKRDVAAKPTGPITNVLKAGVDSGKVIIKNVGDAPKASSNTIFTEDAAAAARARLKAKIGRLNSGLDPEMMMDGITLAGYHIEKGARSFAAYAKAMIGDLGDGVKPFLKSWYMGVKYDPRATAFDGMDSATNIDGFDVDALASEPEKADTDTKDTQNATRQLDSAGKGPLEGVSTDKVQGTPADGSTAASPDGGSGPDAEGNRDTDGAGVPVRGSLGDDQGGLPVSARGSRGKRGSAKQSGVSGNAPVPQGNGSVDTSGGTGGLIPVNPAPNAAPIAAPAFDPQDFTIEDDFALGEGGAKAKFKGNIAAIRLIAQLDTEQRTATPSEQQVLAAYVGWGGLAQAFDANNADWSKEYAELKGLMTEDDYADARTSTRYAHYTSREIIQDGIYAALKHFGFHGGRALEGGAGVGNFIGLMPTDMRSASRFTAIEREPFSAKIARHLYPKQNIQEADFTEFVGNDDFYDVAVGNPPFASDPQVDRSGRKHLSGLSLHNYFFAKEVDMLREGGILAQVVTNSFMDATTDTARQYIADKTKFLGAIRLPNNAFSKNAGTEVTTDLIFLQKRPESEWGGKSAKADAKQWLGVGKFVDREGRTVALNQYFIDNPSMMLGKFGAYGTMYRGESPALVQNQGQDTAALLKEAVARLPSAVYVDRAITNTASIQDALVKTLSAPSVHEGGYFEEDGKLFQRIKDIAGEARGKEITPETMWTAKTKLGEAGFARIKSLSAMRETVRALLAAELSNDPKMTALRKTLNTQYDAYDKEHGRINDPGTLRVFDDDPDFPLLASLEHGYTPAIGIAAARSMGIRPVPSKATKGPIFTQRVIDARQQVAKVETPADALAVSMAERGKLDSSYIGELLGRDADEVLQELSSGDKPLLFKDPATGEYALRDAYLSGNVRAKLVQAKQAGMFNNIKALEEVQPADVGSHEIVARIGSPWVPESVYMDFATTLFGEGTTSSIKYVKETAGYGAYTTAGNNTANTNTWGTVDYPGTDILAALLNNKPIKVTYKDADGSIRTHTEATEKANIKAQDIRNKFQDWLFSDGDRAAILGRAYNDTNNNYVTREFDGEWMTFPGKVPNSIVKFRRHQRNAIARIVQDRTALLDHVVGSGKTYTIIAAAMELRRTGLAKKPMIAVPNHLVKQWAADFYKLYPGANILTATKKDFEKSNRRKFLARIATGDWDAVIIAHSSYGFIRPAPDFEQRFNAEQVANIIKTIKEVESGDGDKQQKKRTVKQLEGIKERLENRIKALRDKPMDALLDFGELGVDQLFVDEAHMFKNLMFTTKMQNIAGLGDSTGSQRAYDMYVKANQIYSQNGRGQGVVFATGTPVSNSLAEMYHMMRYLMPSQMKEMGFESFDAWANTYASVEQVWMQKASGDGFKPQNRMSNFVNTPELLKVFDQVSDTVTMDDIKRAFSEENDGAEFPLPKLKGGKRTPVSLVKSDGQNAYMADIAKRAMALEQRKGPPKKGEDNILVIMSDARKAAMDIRLVDPTVTQREAGGRIDRSSQEIFDRYQQYDKVKGTQIVFSDLGTPLKSAKKELAEYHALQERIQNGAGEQLMQRASMGDEAAQEKIDDAEDAQEELDAKGKDWLGAVQAAERGFSVYDDLKLALIERGIPENEIAFIHDYNTDEQKAGLFRKMNAGQIRVLMGSTPKLGAGTNVQERLVALHHLDVPWKPSDVEQREGRIIRQGNKLDGLIPGFEVEVLAYVTQDTLDMRMWQVQETKLKMINQLRTRKIDRDIENAFEDLELSAGEMQAAATGNMDLLREIQIKGDLKKLEQRKRGFDAQKSDLQSRKKSNAQKLATLPAKIETSKPMADATDQYKQVLAEQEATFTATIDGKEYTSAKEAGAVVLGMVDAHVYMQRQADGKFGGRQLTQEQVSKEPEQDPKAEDYNPWTKRPVPLDVNLNGEQYKSRDKLMEAFSELRGDRDPIAWNLDGKTLIRRSVIEGAIRQNVADAIAEEQSKDIGNLGPFKVSVEGYSSRMEKVIDVALTVNGQTISNARGLGKADENSAQNNVRSIINMAENLAIGARQQHEYEKRQLQQALKEKAELDSTETQGEWPDQGKLEELRKKHQEILARLSQSSRPQVRGDGTEVIASAQDIKAMTGMDAAFKDGYVVMTQGGLPYANSPEKPFKTREAAQRWIDSQVSGKIYTAEPPPLKAERMPPIRFSRGTNSTGLPLAQVNSIVGAIKARWGNAPDIIVATSMSDAAIPQAVRDYDQQQKSLGATGEPEGFVYRGKVYLMADQLDDQKAVMRVLFHESLGHMGLRGVFGDKLDGILKQLSALRRADVAAKAEQYGLDMGKEADRMQAAEEVLAVLAQTKPEMGYVQRAIAAIRSWLRANVPGFGGMKLTDAEIISNFILPARRFIEGGNGPNGGEEAPASGTGSAQASLSRGKNEAMNNAKVGAAFNAMVKNARSDLEGVLFNWQEVELNEDGDRLISRPGRDGFYSKGKDGGKVSITKRSFLEWLQSEAPFDTKIYGPAIAENAEWVQQIKTLRDLIPNESTAPERGGAMFSRSLGASLTDSLNSVRDVALPAGYQVGDLFQGAGRLHWWHKSVGSMYHLAQKSAPFKRVYDSIQNFLNDVSFYAAEAADLAPNILPKLDKIGDVFKSPLSAADTKALGAPVFEGTLTWGRDKNGQAVPMEQIEAEVSQVTLDDRAHMLLKGRHVDPKVLKMWQGLEQDQYEAIINNKFEREFMKPGVVFTPAELAKHFNMTPAQVKLYQEFRKATDKSIDHLAISEMLNYAGKDADPVRDQITDMSDVEEAGQTLRDYLVSLVDAMPERDAVLSATAAKMLDIAAHATDMKNRGYAPLSRFGTYTLEATLPTGERYFSLFETDRERNKMTRLLAGEGATNITTGTMSQEAYKLLNGISPETAALFGEMLGFDSQGTEAKDLAFQQYVKLGTANRSAMKRLLHRKGIAGFSEDAGRVLAGFVYSNARKTASNLHNKETTQAVSDIPKEQGELKDAAVKLQDYVSNPQEEMQAFRGILFAQYLGGSVASAMVNATQPFTVTLPYLSQFGGIRKAAAQMAAAVRDAGRDQTGDARLDAALKKAEEEGIVSPQEVHSLQAQAMGRSQLQSGDGTLAGNALAKGGNALSKLSLAWGKVFSVAEQFNRRTTFIAAYRTAVEQGMRNPAAFAEKSVSETQFVYNRGNKPRWARGAVGSVLFTFKQYSVNYLELVTRMATAGAPGSPERLAGQKAALLAIAILFLMSGADGLPFVEDVEDLIDGAMQRLGYNFNSKQRMKSFLVNQLGKDGADFVSSGVSGLPGVPIDVSGRLGMANLIPGTGLLLKKSDHTRDLMEFAGPAGDFTKRAFTATEQALSGKLGEAITTVAPNAARNVVKGLDMVDTGMYRDTKGNKVIETTAGEAFMKGLGFQPRNVKEVQDASFAVQKSKDQYSIAASEIRRTMANAIFLNDADMKQKARDDLAAWNNNNPDQRMTLNMPAVLSKVREMRKSKEQRMAETAPKAIRAQVRAQLRENLQ